MTEFQVCEDCDGVGMIEEESGEWRTCWICEGEGGFELFYPAPEADCE